MPRMGRLLGRIAGLCLCFALLLPLACNSGSQSSPGGSTNSLDAAAIKAVYITRMEAERDYDADAYLGTFAPDYVNIVVTGRSYESAPEDTVKRWPKPSLATTVGKVVNGLASPVNLPEIISVQSDGKTAEVVIAWHDTSRRTGQNGEPYYYYRDYVSNDKWVKQFGKWVEKSSRFTMDRQSWSVEPIPESERKVSPPKQ